MEGNPSKLGIESFCGNNGEKYEGFPFVGRCIARPLRLTTGKCFVNFGDVKKARGKPLSRGRKLKGTIYGKTYANN